VGIAINETTDEVALLKILNVFETVVHQKNINGKVKIENHRYPIDQKEEALISPIRFLILSIPKQQ
jgi:predicted transcriptional regulator